jgi:hypothetical protein
LWIADCRWQIEENQRKKRLGDSDIERQYKEGIRRIENQGNRISGYREIIR